MGTIAYGAGLYEHIQQAYTGMYTNINSLDILQYIESIVNGREYNYMTGEDTCDDNKKEYKFQEYVFLGTKPKCYVNI